MIQNLFATEFSTKKLSGIFFFLYKGRLQFIKNFNVKFQILNNMFKIIDASFENIY